MMNFKGNRILVTGGTRGIGKQVSEDLVDMGADFVFPTGTSIVDFSDENSTKDFIRRIEDYDFDILINSAGINEINPFLNTSDESWDDILKVNLTGAYKVCKAVAKNMKEKGSGKIINVASIWSHKSKIGRAAYSASKFGLRGLEPN